MQVPNISVTDTYFPPPNFLLNYTSKVYYEIIYISLGIYFHLDIIFKF